MYRIVIRHQPDKKIQSGMLIIWKHNKRDVIMTIEEVVCDAQTGRWLIIEAIA